MSDQYQRDIQAYFHQRKLFRYIFVTFPKTIATVTLGVVAGLSYATYQLIEEGNLQNVATHEAMHLSDGKTRRSKQMVIYSSSNNSESNST
jgi:hypothetical protein